MRPLVFHAGAEPDDQNDFYKLIKTFSDFSHVFDDNTCLPIPADWLIAVCTVEAAPQVARQGRYRDVNVVGASAVVAVLNAVRPHEIPHSFSGDGATFAFPPALRDSVVAALAGTRSMARTAFRLNLRIGIVPLTVIRAAGHDIAVGRHVLSPHVTTSVFAGTGIAHADQMVQGSDTFRLPAGTRGDADFTGLECRWKPVPPMRGHMLTLIVEAAGQRRDTYREVYQMIRTICGNSQESHPLKRCTLRLAARPRHLRQELKTRTQGGGKFRYILSLVRDYLIGRMIFDLKKDFKGLNGEKYLGQILEQSDFQKFDSSLRMVIDVSEAQRIALENFLEQQHQAGRLHYGLQLGSAALVTCLVSSRADNHVHFVDGANGGYAMAALALQEQIRLSVLTQFYADRTVLH